VTHGVEVGNFQTIQFKLADMSAGIEAARWRLRHAAGLKDQIHGAYGYSTDFPIERMYRDAKVYQIWEGTSEIQRMVIGRQLLKEY